MIWDDLGYEPMSTPKGMEFRSDTFEGSADTASERNRLVVKPNSLSKGIWLKILDR